MPELKVIRTSLSVGFANGELPADFAHMKGRAHRDIAATAAFPFEDAQFEIVILAGEAVSRATVREAHRVLKPEGRLLFRVNEKTRTQRGYTLPEIYATVREGYNIIDVRRPAWWFFGTRGRTITICAQKKNWRSHAGFARGGSYLLSPFQNA